MSKYTMELRKLFTPITYKNPIFTREEVEAWFKDYSLSDYLTTEQINVINETGLWTKDKLAKKIVDHYYMREIGFETIGLFIHYAKVTMNELMEEYLPLIYSSAIQYDPLVNVDYTESFNRNTQSGNTGQTQSSSSSSSSSSSDGSALGVNSDTPQGQITKASILAGSYATSTSATENENSVESGTDTSNVTNTQSNSNGLENYTKRVKGNSGVSATAQKMIEQYRNNIRAIDREIIEKLDILFMGLY